MKMEQSVPKRLHIKFRRRGITQKKTYSIQNTAKFCNEEGACFLSLMFQWFHVRKEADTFKSEVFVLNIASMGKVLLDVCDVIE
jgi:hypothetical protein